AAAPVSVGPIASSSRATGASWMWRTWLRRGRTPPRRGASAGAGAPLRGGAPGGGTGGAPPPSLDVCAAGAPDYGGSDLEPLAHDTHKFESRYLDRLVAPLPEGRALYEARAPIRHLEAFRAPLITFQGAQDKVVPPDQSRTIVSALKSKGVPVAYIE